MHRFAPKRLQPFLPEAIRVLERCQDIKLSKDTKELLLKISSASIDRCLRPIRLQTPHGLRTTKPGSLLKNLIPVRTFTEWDAERPGFLETDLVAHCGNTTEGQFLCTLTCTDLCTDWTDVAGLLHRDDLRLYINFFQPSFKLIAKERIGNKTIKRYDIAKTPYQRVLERKAISLEAKARLMTFYVQLNPTELRCRIDQKIAKLWKISR